MSIHISSNNIGKTTYLVLVICMLFFVFDGKAQQDAQKVYDSVMELSITGKEKIEIFKSKILHENYTDKELHADVCYLVVNECNKVDKASAIPFLRKEMALRKKYVTSNKDLIARTYYNLGYFNWTQEKYNKMFTYQDSLLSYVSVKDRRCGKAYNIMGLVYKAKGDYQRSLDYFKQAETILKKVNEKRSLLSTYINKLTLFVEQKSSMTSKDFKALELEVLNLANEVGASAKQRLKILFNLGAILYTNHQNKTSLNYYNQSLPIAEQLEDSLRIAQIYSNTALIHVRNEETDDALLLNEKALLFVGNDADEKSIIYDNLGDLYVKLKQYEKGLKHHNKAINELLSFDWETKENLPEYEKVINSPSRKDILGYLIDKQNAWLSFYDFTNDEKYLLAAEETMQLIDKTIDYVYFESKEKLSKLFWRKKGAALYINAVKICFLLNKPTKAFYYIEKNKGVLLLDNISAFSAKRIAKLPQEIIEKEQVLHQKVKALEQEFVSNIVSDSLKTHYFTAKEAYYKYLKTIEKDYPEYQRYRTSLPMLSSENVQKSLVENEVVVAYILGDDLGYVLLMDQKTVKIVPLDDLRSLKTRITAFQKLYAKPFETSHDAVSFQQLGNGIYQKLLPFQKDSSYLKATKITIIPDGFINALPLEILPTNSIGNLHDSYLIQKKELSYRYSFSLDAQNKKQLARASSKSTSFMLTEFQDDALTTLTERPTEFFDNATHINKNATKASFLKAYNEASQVYVSSHAGNTNNTPWLAMFDGKVYPNELYFLNNPKELVVLNACKSSTGIFKEGEGVFSLTRAFLNSGSKSVVASLWNVNEKAGMEIFNSFRANLNKSQTKSKALQNAKIAYLEKYKNTSQSSPYYWGGIVLTGNTDILPAAVNYWKIIGMSLAGIAIFLLYFKLRKRKYEA
ncbi:CHAT domain-containing protein [uncultured Kordia sp.]|uniref:CHAT domain-containing protein n=1 Tax=uncultured Kordia sp. TaxID=507699 RepID=UPI0026391CBD|nr:CHAT domain-containing tetratricopeptide repeat protein [uncultured Kordia sp.]